MGLQGVPGLLLHPAAPVTHFAFKNTSEAAWCAVGTGDRLPALGMVCLGCTQVHPAWGSHPRALCKSGLLHLAPCLCEELVRLPWLH